MSFSYFIAEKNVKCQGHQQDFTLKEANHLCCNEGGMLVEFEGRQVPP